MLGYLSADIICSEKRTVFRERSSRKTVSYEEQILSTDKYPSIFSPQMEAIALLSFKSFRNAPRNIRSRDALRPIARERKDLMDYKLGYLSADIICSEKRTVFRERSLRKTVSYEEQIMSKDKYPSL